MFTLCVIAGKGRIAGVRPPHHPLSQWSSKPGSERVNQGEAVFTHISFKTLHGARHGQQFSLIFTLMAVTAGMESMKRYIRLKIRKKVVCGIWLFTM